ncbi:hypothetical protein LIER_10658 [Lithospermum erythrorhizon]|uniref:Uncharacterized protein n=1 Tax=Lithospermum erythrorhizon TaxID=34254 RepID=A0AAV3PK23_LITER
MLHSNNIVQLLDEVTNLKRLKQIHAYFIRNSLQIHHDIWVAQLLTLCTRFHAPPLYTRRVCQCFQEHV